MQVKNLLYALAGAGISAAAIALSKSFSSCSLASPCQSWLSDQALTTLLNHVGGSRGQEVRKAEFLGYHLTNQTEQDPTYQALKDVWKRVAARTQGKLNMVVLAKDAELPGADNEAVLATSGGRFDAVTANAPIFSGIIPQVANIMTLLFAYDSSEEGLWLVNQPTFQQVLAEKGEAFNLTFLPEATFNAGMRVVTSNSTRVFDQPKSIKGFRLRTPPSAVVGKQLRAIGVIPIATPITRLIDAITSGMVDGQENPPSYIESVGINNVNNQISVTNHLWSGFLTAINSQSWNSWPKAWQIIVKEEFKNQQPRQWAQQESLNQTLLQQAPQRLGMLVVRPNLTSLRHDPKLIKAREQVVMTLDPRLQPLARKLMASDASSQATSKP